MKDKAKASAPTELKETEWFRCDICRTFFRNQLKLNFHIRRTHKNVPYDETSKKPHNFNFLQGLQVEVVRISEEEIASTLQLSKLRNRPKPKLMPDGQIAKPIISHSSDSNDSETDDQDFTLPVKSEVKTENVSTSDSDSDPEFTTSSYYHPKKTKFSRKRRGRRKTIKQEPTKSLVPKRPYKKRSASLGKIRPPKHAYCKLCPTVNLHSKQDWTDHMMECHQKDFVCSVCNKSFAEDPTNLVPHISRHAPVTKSIQCEFCCKTFGLQWQYENHLKIPGIHDKSRWLHKCNDCGDTFLLIEEMRKHRREVHIKRKPKSFFCSVCNKGYAKKDKLKAHYNLHLKNNPFACTFPNCKSAFDNRYHLTRHLSLHVSRAKYPCPECGVSFPIPEYLTKHVDRVHKKKNITDNLIIKPRSRQGLSRIKHIDQVDPSESKDFDPNKVLTTPAAEVTTIVGGIIIHKTKEDQSDKNIFIPAVYESQRNEENNDKQLVEVNGHDWPHNTCFPSENLKSYSYAISQIQKHLCTLCPAQFARVHLLRDHLFRVHGQTNFDNLDDILPIICKLCGLVADHKAHLEEHMKSEHGGKKVKCPKCGCRFHTVDEMSKHLHRVHLADRNFECPRCGKRFHARHNMKSHLHRVHESAGRFECSICFRVLTNLKSLKAHALLHEKTRRLKVCKLCGEKLSNDLSLRRHVRLIHSKDSKLEKSMQMKQLGRSESEKVPTSNSNNIECDNSSYKNEVDCIVGL